MKDQLLSHVAMGGNVAEANQLTGRKKAKWPIGL